MERFNCWQQLCLEMHYGIQFAYRELQCCPLDRLLSVLHGDRVLIIEMGQLTAVPNESEMLFFLIIRSH